MVVPAFPHYLTGFVLALDPVPGLTPFVVQVVSDAFGSLPDEVLLPCLPNLITTLRTHAREFMPTLVREAGRILPGTLRALDQWTPPWTDAPLVVEPVAAGTGLALLASHPATVDAVAVLLGLDPGAGPVASPGLGLLKRHPDTAAAVAALLLS
jgi:hypothetical protein